VAPASDLSVPPPAEVPVLIVGGGPVGLGLAIDLGLRGIRCLLVEQGDGTIEHPRANAQNARTMEFCRRWGVADQIRAEGTPPDFPHTVLYVTSMNGWEIARLDRPTHGGGAPLAISPERPQRCNQIWFDRILAERAATLPSVTMRFGCRFDTFAETPEGVTAALEDRATGRRHEVRAQWLVACCGGRSAIPRLVGAGTDVAPALGYPVNIFFRTRELWAHHDKGKSSLNFLIGPEGLWGNVTAIDGRELWRLTLQGTETWVDPKTIDVDAMLRRAIGADFPREVIRTVGWTRRDFVAPRYRFGRVLIAGDCAHQHSPAGGFGMNTGMGDAVDLGWKLAAVVEGWGGPALIDSYEIERRPVGIRNVAAATANFRAQTVTGTEAVCDDTPAGGALRERLGARLAEEHRKQFISDGIALGYAYDPSPVVVPDGSPRPDDSIQRYAPTTRPGSRAPHATMADGRSTLDLFGDGFVLMRLGARAPDAGGLAAAAASRRVPLRVETVDDAAVAALYERRLVLVRPDGHVAWRGDDVPADPLSVIDRVRGAA
jgi:2-polyprenyl-6-methoxyphenol hydroxylase-like FAD-dependent oxidoreductase